MLMAKGERHGKRDATIVGVAGLVLGGIIGCYLCSKCPNPPTAPPPGGPQCPTGTPGAQAPGTIFFYEVDVNGFPVVPAVVIGSANLLGAGTALAFLKQYGYPDATSSCGFPALYQGTVRLTTYVGGTSPTKLIGDLGSPTFGYWYSESTGRYNSNGTCTSPGGFTV